MGFIRFAALMALALVLAAMPRVVSAAMSQDQLGELLRERAIAHNADPELVIGFARCEGGGSLTPDAIGAAGERGMAQWYPGRGNHYDMTPNWTAHRIDVVALYRAGDPDAVWFDADSLAWFIGEGPRAAVRSGWVTCSARLGV